MSTILWTKLYARDTGGVMYSNGGERVTPVMAINSSRYVMAFSNTVSDADADGNSDDNSDDNFDDNSDDNAHDNADTDADSDADSDSDADADSGADTEDGGTSLLQIKTTRKSFVTTVTTQ